MEDVQIEQDLVISRALVDIFSQPLLHNALAFRGGTALYKLHLRPAARYSEDIDLVQIKAEAAGPVIDIWFEGQCRIHSYELDELLGTKLRTLYQRAQGRDLFDLATALESGRASPERIVEAFSAYMKHGGHVITRQQFEKNLALKMEDAEFTADIGPLFTAGHEWDIATAAAAVSDGLIALLPDSKRARKRANLSASCERHLQRRNAASPCAS